MIMDIRDLEVFLAMVRHSNFSRAGKEVHLSQPSVSIRVHHLEDELQTRLFEQIGKKVALTEAGRLFEPYARRVVAALDDSRRAIAEYRGLEQGSLRIGASTTPGMYLTPRIIAGFKRRHPRIAIRLAIKNTRQIEEGIIGNEFDLGFVGGHLISNEIETLHWRTDELVLTVLPEHPLAGRKQIKPDDLANETFINREPGSATRAAIEMQLNLLNTPFESSLELGNPETVKQAVKDGLGIAFLSRFAIETELKTRSLIALNVRGLHIYRELKIIYRKGRHLSRADSAFIEIAEQLKYSSK
jgi:DNA-binding transcriptional LysR family regulator